MQLLAAVSSSYRIGEYTGLILLLLALAWCILRAFRILPRATTAGATGAILSIPAQPSQQVSGSVAPPGFSVTPTALTHQATPESPAAIRWGYMVAALALAVLLTFGVMRTANAHSGPWDSGQGALIKTGFMDGCRQSGGSAAVCGCLFSQLTAQPAYSTPSGFQSLATDMREFLWTHDTRWLPDNFQTIEATCRTVT